MPAPSKAWVAIADTAVDPDSPVDQALMQGLRDDAVHLREWLGLNYTAAVDHDHDGNNSKAIAGEVGTIKPWPGIALPSALWDWCDGLTLSRATCPILKDLLMREAVVTMTIATPCVVTWVAHGLRDNLPIRFFTTGALPTGITAGTHGGPGVGTEYYVKVINADTFNISSTPGGANVNTSGTQSGTHTAVVTPHGDGDGSTTFHKPDMRGRVPIGRDDMGGTAANRMTAAGAGIEARVQGRSGGTQTHTLSASEMPGHVHNEQMGNGGVGSVVSARIRGNVNSGSFNTLDPLTSSLTDGGAMNTGNAGASATHQNTQPGIVEDWIIRIS